MKYWRAILALFIFISVIGHCTSTHAYIRAVHYWVDGWPKNFWNSLKSHRIEEDLKQIKKDGFDTIVLAVPWGEFQPKIRPIQYNKRAFGLLKNIVEKAKENKMNVILRLSYLWDFDPDAELPTSERFMALYTDPVVYKAWLDFFRKVNYETKDFKNLLFGFITWEDLWGIVCITSSNLDLAARQGLSPQTGFHQYITKKYSRKYLSDLYGYNIRFEDTIPIPERKSPAYRLFLEYVDMLLIEKFFKPAKKYFPKLSLEVRVDADPIFLSQGEIFWYSHANTYNLPGSDIVTAYYSVATGALNRGDEIPAKRALELFAFNFKKIKEQGSVKKVFIDQFNFFDNTPAFTHNTKIGPDELNKFIVHSASPLMKYTDGYGLWAYRDYAENGLYNPSFEVGLKGWDIKGKVDLAEGNNGDKKAMLRDGSSITQFAPRKRGYLHNEYKNVYLCFWAKAETSSHLYIYTAGIKIIQDLNENGRNYCLTLPMKDEYTLTFEARDGNVLLDDTSLYCHVQKSLLYGLDGKPDSAINAIRR